MTTPIKVLVSEFQARKISTGNQTVIIQIRRKAGEPVKKFKAKLCDLEEIRPPYLEPLITQGIISPVDALYEQFVAEGGLDKGGTSQGACGNLSSVKFHVYTGAAPALLPQPGGNAPGSRVSKKSTTFNNDLH